jgi:hypothetical protein
MPTSAGRLRRSLGARQGVLVVMDLVESVKAASGARVRSRCASVSRMAWLSWPLWVLGHEKRWSPKGSRSLPQEHLVLIREVGRRRRWRKAKR